MVHDDYGTRVGQSINVSVDEIRNLPPLPTQTLTEEDKRRLQNLGRNGDRIDAETWGAWTSSVPNHQATAEQVLKNTLPTSRSGSK
jgi:catalase